MYSFIEEGPQGKLSVADKFLVNQVVDKFLEGYEESTGRLLVSGNSTCTLIVGAQLNAYGFILERLDEYASFDIGATLSRLAEKNPDKFAKLRKYLYSGD